MARRNPFEGLDFHNNSGMLNDAVNEINEAAKTSSTQEIKVDKLIPFKDHPFKVDTEGEAFDELVTSIKEQGLIYPLLVRPLSGNKLGKYEVIAGHRRLAACKVAGLPTVTCIVKEMDEYTATILMVHSNFYREKINPSEKAKAYRMCIEASKHQGVKGGDTATMLSEDEGIGRATFFRYVNISYLNDDLLKMIDDNKLALLAGELMKDLSSVTQSLLVSVINQVGVYPDKNMAVALRKKGEANNGEISREDIANILMEKEKVEKPKTSISFKVKDIRAKYFEEDTSAETIESTIDNLLVHYKNGDFDSILGAPDNVIDSEADDEPSDESSDEAESESITDSIMNDHEDASDDENNDNK